MTRTGRTSQDKGADCMTANVDLWSRRQFLGGVGLAGAAGALSLGPETAAAEPPPETTTIRMPYDPEAPSICYAPVYVAEELLRGEGFGDVRYVRVVEGSEVKTLVGGQADLSTAFGAELAIALDQGKPIVALTGLHVGCIELVGAPRVKAVRDLRGRTVSVEALDAADHIFVSMMAAYVGLDPKKDLKWAVHTPADAIQRLADGNIDALCTYPPFTHELRAKKIGHAIVRTATDRPWSEQFCCMIAGNRDWVRRHPVATKRALRAILKANQICTVEPERAARLLVDRKFTPQYDYALATLRELPYGRWREYDPASTLRFYALRLHELGIVKASPQKLITQGSDWRFLDELKKELKG
jgi:NitT/TauT family transport system substrate-binding protein